MLRMRYLLKNILNIKYFFYKYKYFLQLRHVSNVCLCKVRTRRKNHKNTPTKNNSTRRSACSDTFIKFQFFKYCQVITSVLVDTRELEIMRLFFLRRKLDHHQIIILHHQILYVLKGLIHSLCRRTIYLCT